jgi:uncharacterized membrane protein
MSQWENTTIMILLMASASTVAVILLGMLFFGIKRRKIVLEPSSPPIGFKEKPLTYICCALGLGFCGFGLVVATFRIALKFMESNQ